MTALFRQYIQAHRNATAQVKQLFKTSKKPLFIANEHVYRDADFSAAENILQCKLPEAYKIMLGELGGGTWADGELIEPQNLYPFDDDCGTSAGLIALVKNVDDNGNYVAFKPDNQEIYFCDHDTERTSKIAQCFDDYLKLIAEKFMADPTKGPRRYFESL